MDKLHESHGADNNLIYNSPTRSDEEYSEYSTTSSSNNDAEYLSFIRNDGSIFYVKCSIVPTLNRIDPTASEDDHVLFRAEYKRMSLRGPASVLSAKLGARKIKDKNPFGIKVLKKNKIEEADKRVKEVCLTMNMKKVKPLNGVKFLERVLGIVPSVSLAKRLVVAQVKENCSFSKDGFVKPGDVIKSIGHDSITNENLESVIKNLTATQIKIVFHEMLENSPLNSIDIKITTIGDLIDNMHLLFGYERSLIALRNEIEYSPFCMMYISKLEDTDGNLITPKFCYPVKEKNVLYPIRGCFLTLQSVLETSLNAKPKLSTFKVHRTFFHVVYECLETGILLLGFNTKYCTLFEAKQHAQNFSQSLRFIFDTENTAFENDHTAQLHQLCEIKQIQLTTHKKHISEIHFEKSLPQPQFVALPKEIQLRIDDAISELEAMDFFNWTDSDTVIDALQELVIIGCALYYRQFLISTHLSANLIQEIENLANHLAIHEIMNFANVKKMIVWQQVFPKYEPQPDKKRFVIFTSQGSLMMATMLEEKIAKNIRVSNLKTSLSYYVEEMQDILEYFRLTGVENLTRIWMTSNKRPEILQPHKSNTLDGVSPQKQTTATTSSSLRENVSDDSDSDWDDPVNSGRSSSGFDSSDIIYNDFQEIIPSILNTGTENLIFHFVQIEHGEGVLVAPTFPSNFTTICNTFRKASIIIHQVLQNTVKFRQMLANNDMNVNGGQWKVPVKEHGILVNVSSKVGKLEKFWVIGRLFSTPPRELYVCHRSSTPQNMIELAFKICMSGAG